MNTTSLLLDFLMPRLCHLCGERLAGSEQYICTACATRLPRTNYHRLPDNPMEQRFAGIFPFERAAGHFFYTPASDPAILIHDLKYRHFRNLGRYLGELMGRELLTSGFLGDADRIIPVPMHFLKQGMRGYNQTEQLAIGLSAATGIPVDTSLRAIRPHKTQTRLSHAQRMDNTRGIFHLKNPSALAGKHVVLLDDVCTTGATLTSAAEAMLADCPGLRITLLTLAVTF